ncbi:hypothetical protein ACFLZO_00500 [Patescibacteria group bacterium]
MGGSFTQGENMSLDRLRQPEAPIADLVETHGYEAVTDELDDMCFHDLADLALTAAIKIGNETIARTAARIIVNSGSYSQQVRDTAMALLDRA